MKSEMVGKARRDALGLVSSLSSGFWAARKAYQAQKNYKGRPRETSFPFVSSDTFRAIADIVIPAQAEPGILERIPYPDKPAVIKVELGFLKDKGGIGPLRAWLEGAAASTGGNQKLILHTHDWVPAAEDLASFVEAGATVYCPNVLDYIPGVVPIPVGLENLTRRKNGVLDDYLLSYDRMREFPARLPKKTNMLFASFKIGTNEKAREPLALALEKSRFGFSYKRLKMSDNRRQVIKSHFVLSPPGNGPDCYRTWESIYLGAVPIVSEGSLAHSIYEDLPIWVVENWDEAIGASDSELLSRYQYLINKSKEKAFFPFWQRKIREALV